MNQVKRLLVTLSLTVITVAPTQAQGTIAFGNSATTPVTDFNTRQPVDFAFNVAVYFATGPGQWQGPVQPIGRGAASTGVFSVPSASAYQIPGTGVGQVVTLQIYAWEAAQGDDPYLAWQLGARTAITGTRQITLGPTAGPGTVIWSGNPDNPLRPLQFGLANPAPPVVPEPSVLALAALGGITGLIVLRRKNSSAKQ
jgi:hypothetical protein